MIPIEGICADGTRGSLRQTDFCGLDPRTLQLWYGMRKGTPVNQAASTSTIPMQQPANEMSVLVSGQTDKKQIPTETSSHVSQASLKLTVAQR